VEEPLQTQKWVQHNAKDNNAILTELRSLCNIQLLFNVLSLVTKYCRVYCINVQSYYCSMLRMSLRNDVFQLSSNHRGVHFNTIRARKLMHFTMQIWRDILISEINNHQEILQAFFTVTVLLTQPGDAVQDLCNVVKIIRRLRRLKVWFLNVKIIMFAFLYQWRTVCKLNQVRYFSTSE
jgi:hypothetical protein